MIPWAVCLLIVAAVGSGRAADSMSKSQLSFTVTPSAAGRQLIRVSLPFPAGMAKEGQTFLASDGQREVPAMLRALTWWPTQGSGNRLARRALVTFPYAFPSQSPVRFSLQAGAAAARGRARLPVEVKVGGEMVTV